MKAKIILSLLLLSIAVPALSASSATATFTFTCTVNPYIAVNINENNKIALNDDNFAVIPIVTVECSGGECNLSSEKIEGVYTYSATME